MTERYLLYIDILGFEDLVRNEPARVEDLYEIIASLNVHRHWGFAIVGFSDTILIHNTFPPDTQDWRHYTVMYSCEFAQDLFHRLAARKLFFRAVLTYGSFEHYQLNHQHYYYGPALIDCYKAEKAFPITGLLIDDKCLEDNRIFSHRPFLGWHYLFFTQGLDYYEDVWQGLVPLPLDEIEQAGWTGALVPELETLHTSLLLSRDHPDEEVRLKHKNTIDLYRLRYPKVFAALEPRDLKIEYVNQDFDWSVARESLNESFAFGSERTEPEPGTTGRPYKDRSDEESES